MSSALLDELAGPAPGIALRERRLKRIAQAFGLELADALAPYFDQYAQPLVQPIAGRAGWQELIIGASPPAGADFIYLVPGEEVVKPLSIMCRLACSAVVGQRSLTVEFRDSEGIRYLVAGAEVTLAASQTQSFCWHPTAGTPSWPVNDAALAPLPPQFIYPTCSLVIAIAGVQAGDQLDQVRLSVEKFQTGDS